MQEIVENFRKKGKLFKNFEEISPKELKIRNKIKIYKATDLNGYFYAIFHISKKSRVLTKDVENFEKIYYKLTKYKEHNFKYKVIFIQAPLCSKAKDYFKELKWKVNVTL
jgi:hypothetical protein